jgi:phenylalanyl-tRNA synthetase beta chain
MKISPNWVREFVDITADDHKLAEDLTGHGIAVESISGEGGSTVYEVEFNANRPDAMNHYGVARECAAMYDLNLRPVAVKLPALAMAARAGADFDPRPDKKAKDLQPFPIVIEDAEGCARYTAQVVRDVKIGPSPGPVIERLQSVEQRSISNVADATNYTLWEMGHPTHAFDLDRLEGGTIIVRRARQGEMLQTLDGVERKLFKEDLVIADAQKAVALAGVMGGAGTMITAGTRNVLIEAAWFDPVSIRKTARRHGMHTDASHRFERGADFAATPLACARVAQLILESAGGKLDGAAVDAVARQITRPMLSLRRREVQRILGKEIGEAEIERILRRLGFEVVPQRVTVAAPVRPPRAVVGAPVSGGTHAAIAEEVTDFAVQPPTWRLDIEREVDVIEEIARIHGYEKFPNTLPAFAGAVVKLAGEDKDTKVRRTLLALGYDEALSWTFIGEEDARTFSSGSPLPLENPISDEAAVMRPSLLPGMLQMLAWNLNRGNDEVHLFEMGHVFAKFGERADERARLSLGATGKAEPAYWDRAARPYTFFEMKGSVEQVLNAFAFRALYFDPHAGELFHPGRSARVVVDGTTIARFGQLHPDLAAARKLRQDVYVGEIDLDRLYQHALREPHYTPIPRFPAVGRDFSFLLDDAITWERIRQVVDALHIPALCSFVPVEVFRGGAVEQGKYSVLLRAEFQSAERTLTDQEVTVWAQQIIAALQALGGILRS